jgi:uncharacterized RDD family membrane protein YckC
MFCSKCGAKLGEGAVFCNSCGQPVPAAANVPLPVAIPPIAPSMQVPPAGAVIRSTPVPPGVYPPPMDAGLIVAPRPYAGFWLRLVAYLIDSVVALVVTGVVLGVCVLGIGVGTLKTAFSEANPQDPALPFAIMGWFIFGGFVMLVLQWLYFAWMESSEHQATLGKMALGLIVTDLNDQRVSFGRATGRFFAKIITSYTFFIGYIMAGFTEKKQALHDMIASTLVLRKI